jgi:hypothetical protein
MMEEGFVYWEYHYVSCEGNPRWSIARTPEDWSEYDLQEAVMKESGYDDAPAEFSSAFETQKPSDDIYTDFSECED